MYLGVTVFCALMLVFSVVWAFFKPREMIMPIVSTLLLLGLFVFVLFITPRYYVFSDTGLAMYFLCGFYKQYEWKSVKRIYRFNRRRHFFIDGTSSGKKSFFTELCSSVVVDDETERLMGKYWKRKIQ